MSMLKKCSVVLSMLACVSFLPGEMKAAEYPAKPITLISPYGAGGDSDLSARVWAEFARKEFGQPVLVVNKTGGGGLTGTLFASKAKADGYTLFLAQAGPCVMIPLTTSAGGLGKNSFEFLSRFAIGNPGVVVKADAPWNNLNEFEAAAKAADKPFIYSDPSSTSWLNFAFRGWMAQNNVPSRVVSYSSGAETATSIIGGHCDISMLFPANYVSLVQGGELKLLAVGAPDPKFPGVKSYAEQGYKGNYYAWSGIAIPAGAPQEIKDKIIAVTDKITQNPDFIKAIENIGFLPDNTSGEAFQAQVEGQFEEMVTVLKDLGFKTK